uniref:Uncharacterized protein n=1 Tax=Arundo donax TaxID=35708 RepID=A0A0A8YK14_ARUDO
MMWNQWHISKCFLVQSYILPCVKLPNHMQKLPQPA